VTTWFLPVFVGTFNLTFSLFTELLRLSSVGAFIPIAYPYSKLVRLASSSHSSNSSSQVLEIRRYERIIYI